MAMGCYLLLVTAVICQLFAAVEADLKPFCDVHSKDSSAGYPAPKSILGQKATPEWLYPSSEDISAAFKVGKAECEAHLAKNKDSMKKLSDLSDFQPKNSEKCRGTDMLYRVTGMMLWPFGPANHCPTYSKCWFGLLSCGTPAVNGFNAAEILQEAKRLDPDLKDLPPVRNWTIQSVYTHMRVVGSEIVVPEQRVWSVVVQGSEGGKQEVREDVMIGQYVLTKQYEKQIKLELRQDEFYPAVLYEWPQRLVDLGVYVGGNLYLGSNENRCRPWTKCVQPNILPQCEKQCFVVNTPITVSVPNGQGQCPEAATSSVSLPLCPSMSSKQPGRWIQATSSQVQPGCREVDAGTKLPKTAAGHTWAEASGDPCVIHNVDNEEEAAKTWFYAPYRCKYHFYEKDAIHQCFKSKGITHVHFQGDSMSRDLFGQVSRTVGVQAVSEGDLKKLTNVLKENKLETHTGDLLLSEGYSWDWDPKIMSLVQQVPLPQVAVSNFALAHRHSDDKSFLSKFNSTELGYWKHQHGKEEPRIRIFQAGKDVHGKKSGGLWSSENIRRNSEILRSGFSEVGFHELDEWLLTAGRIDNYADRMDGWHFFGTMKQMEAMVMMNMICNDWLLQQK